MSRDNLLSSEQDVLVDANTITRVWESMVELGGSDLEERTRQVSPSQPRKQILSMDLETATGLLEDRYCHLDLLDESAVSTGSVTPVVTQPTAGTA